MKAKLQFQDFQFSFFVLFSLPTEVEPTSDPKSDKWDGVVLVCENLDWECGAIDFLKKPIQDAQQVFENSFSCT